MDRVIIYPGSIPLETDLLSTNKNSMVGLSKLAAAVLGTGTLLNGLACSPDSPASLNVRVAAGEIYSLVNIDGTAYSSLAADTTHTILKQGILLDSVLLSCPAPATAGQSINYLVQVIFSETDSGAVVLPYYNSSNPAQAYSGPNNAGTAQNTARRGLCTVNVKAGVSATTGTQVTPAPDAGYTAAHVVTVANAQTTITSGNISTATGAPFILNTLTQLAPLISPAFTGTPTAPTAPVGDNTTKVASTAFVSANAKSKFYMLVRDEKATGVGGGSSVVGAQTRTLNTVVANTITGASLSANAITLPAGTYRIKATAPSLNTNKNRAYLYNVTDSSILALGSSENSTINSASDGVSTKSNLNTVITLTATKQIELRHYCEQVYATIGLGSDVSDGQVEVYSTLEIDKE